MLWPQITKWLDDDSVSSSDTGDDSSTEERVDKAALDAMLDDGDADEDAPLVAPRTKNEIVDQPKFIPPPGPITDNDTLKIVGHITSLHLDIEFAVALGVSNGPPVADGSVLCAADPTRNRPRRSLRPRFEALLQDRYPRGWTKHCRE